MSSIAVVVLDTCRADTFWEHFAWLDGRRFTNAWSTSHWTIPAHASVYTGQYGSECGSTCKDPSLDADDTVIGALGDAGYRRTLITNNLQISTWDGWLTPYDRSFGPIGEGVKPVPDGIIDWGDFNARTDDNGLSMYAKAVLTACRPEFDTLRSIWHGYKRVTDIDYSADKAHERLLHEDFSDEEFLLINVMDMHGPYFPPPRYRSVDRRVDPEPLKSLLGSVDSEPKRQAYTDCARYLSDKYREIHEDLRAEFDYVITISDHGEMLGEDRLHGHVYGLQPELARVPIVISGPGVDDETVDDPVSLIDIHATIADIAEVDVTTRGDSLLTEGPTEDRLVEYHGLRPQFHETFDEADALDVFDTYNVVLDGIVAAEGYAYETVDGFVVEGDWSDDEARHRLDALVESIDRQELIAEDVETSAEVQRRLEDLGYA